MLATKSLGQEQAALHYVYGYALNATGRSKEGEEQFRKGLAIPRIGAGYEHLLELELAFARFGQGDARGAIEAAEAAEAAAKLIPEDPISWQLLDYLYAQSHYPDAAVKAEQARSKAERFANDEKAFAKLSNVLPSDFWVMTLGYSAGRAEVDTAMASSAGQSSPKNDCELCTAARQGDLSRVNELLAAKANVDAKDGAGATALMWASEGGHIEVAQALIAANADVNAKDTNHGGTALMMASNTAAVQVLLAAKADVNEKDNIGKTALMWASTKGHADVALALIAANADVNARDTFWGSTALIAASTNGDIQLVQALLAARADVNAKDRDGETALMGASSFGHAEVVQALLAAEADINAKSGDGTTALMLAKQNGHKEVVQLLEHR